MQESGCRLEHPSAAKFRESVMAGDWERVSFIWHSIQYAILSLAVRCLLRIMPPSNVFMGGSLYFISLFVRRTLSLKSSDHWLRTKKTSRLVLF